MTRARLTDYLLYTLSGLALFSFGAAMLLAHHSFGGGHGHYDLLVTLLGLPCSILLPFIPDILLARHSDLFNIVALPWLLNSALAVTLYVAARPAASKS